MNQLKRDCIIGVFFVCIVGTLSHFVYDWSGENRLLGLFFPVNESTWEHMKLVFFPMLLYAAFMNQRLKEANPCVTRALLWGILTGTGLIPVIFYIYTGILGQNFLVLDIATFVISVVGGFVIVYRQAQACSKQKSGRHTLAELLPAVLVFLMLICFLVFSYHPPMLGLFQSPV